jgi:hypothetical protein
MRYCDQVYSTVLYTNGICLETCNGDIDKFSPINDRGDKPLDPEMFLSSQKIFPQERKHVPCTIVIIQVKGEIQRKIHTIYGI